MSPLINGDPRRVSGAARPDLPRHAVDAPSVVGGEVIDGPGGSAQKISNSPAPPMPPPMHMVTTP